MSNIFLKRLFQKSLTRVWNAHFISSQKSVTPQSKIYAVVVGREPGFYSSWEDCEKQIKHYKAPRFKKFNNKEEALLYFENSINCIEALHPKERKSLKHLKNLLSSYKEDWESNFKDLETTQCKSTVNVFQFNNIYHDESSVSADEYFCELLPSSEKRISENNIEAGLSSLHLEGGLEHGLEHDDNSSSDFYSIYNEDYDDNEDFKEIADENYLCRNMSVYLDENVTDMNTEIRAAFGNLGNLQQAELERICAQQNSEKLKNLKNTEKKVLGYLEFSNIQNKMCKDEEKDHVKTNICSSSSPTFPENKTTDNNIENFPPHFFNLERIPEIEYGEKVVDGYLELYTDGSCFSNGTDDAYGAVGIYFGRESKLNTSILLEGKVTNNIAEIRAASLGLQKAHENGFTRVKLFTDSNYVVKCFTHWLEGWKQNNWRKSNGTPVLNQEELKHLDETISKMDDVKLIFVRGHKGIDGNMVADQLARECALASRNKPN